MTNSESAAADQRLMDAMRAAKQHRKMAVYDGTILWVDAFLPNTPIQTRGEFLSLREARLLHRELGEALAAIESQFGEKPVEETAIEQFKRAEKRLFDERAKSWREQFPSQAMLQQANETLERYRAMGPAEQRESWIKELIVPEPVVPPKCTGPGAPCRCSIHSATEPLKPTFTMNYPKPEDAPGARETIWGSWSDTPTVAK